MKKKLEAWARIAVGWLSHTLARTFGTVAHRQLGRQLDEELESHLQLLIDDFVNEGLSHEDARRRALLTLGNRDALRDEYVRVGSIAALEELFFDLRLAWRQLRTSPRFAFNAVSVLAVAVLVSSVMSAIALSPRTVPGFGRNAADVFVLSNYPVDHSGEWNPFEISLRLNAPEYELIRSYSRTLQGLSPATQVTVLLQQDGSAIATSIPAANVGEAFFSVLRVPAALGRTFDGAHPEEDDKVLLSDSLWRSRFNSDPNIVGRRLTIDRHPFQVIGVMPEGFSFPANSRLWFADSPNASGADRQRRRWDIFARLAPGVSVDQAEAELNQITGAALHGRKIELDSLPEAYGGRGLDFVPIMVAAAALLAVGLINLTVLFLAHVVARSNEFAVRVALGASRSRLIRQVIAQGLLVGAAALAIAGPLAFILAPRLLAWLSRASLGFPQQSSSIALRCTLWCAALALASGISCAVFPALQAVRTAMPSGSGSPARPAWRSRLRWRRTLVISQVAFALVLFIAAAQMYRTFFLRWLEFDYRHSGKTLVVAMAWVNNSDSMARDRINSAYEDALRSAGSIPGVVSASLASHPPFYSRPALGKRIQVQGDSAHPTSAVVQSVSASYLPQLGIAVLKGRSLEERDAHGPPVAVISGSLARHFFTNENPLGRRIRVEDESEVSAWMTIVGVVADANISPLSAGSELTVYRPFQQEILTARQVEPRCLILRTETPAQANTEFIRQKLAETLPALKIYRVESLAAMPVRTHKEEWHTSQAVTLLLMGVSLVATFLAAIGVYGLFQQWALERRRETAIRLAVGASSRAIVRAAVSNALGLLGWGVCLGMAGAMVLVELISNLFMVPAGLATFVGCALILATIAFAAMYSPIRAAAKISPMTVLRWE